MTGKTHAVIGANALWLLPTVFNQAVSPLYIPIAMFAALLPDLDASESTIKHLDVSVGGVRVKPFYPIAVIFSHLFHHRGWLHSGIAIIVVAALSWAGLASYDPFISLVVTLGYASHSLADACTISGIQFFLPISTMAHLLPRPLRIKTGGLIDMLLFVIGSLGIAALLRFVTSI